MDLKPPPLFHQEYLQGIQLKECGMESCPACIFYNFVRRMVCMKCAAWKPGAWQCSRFGRDNSECRALCHWCCQPRGTGVAAGERTSTSRKRLYSEGAMWISQSILLVPERRAKSPKTKIIPYTGPSMRQRVRSPRVKIIPYKTPLSRAHGAGKSLGISGTAGKDIPAP